MANLPFLHLLGEQVFRRFDHDGTTLDAASETLRLATIPSGPTASTGIDPKLFDDYLARRGGAIQLPCPPDRCSPPPWLLVDPTGSMWIDRGKGLIARPSAVRPSKVIGGALRFTPSNWLPSPTFSKPSALDQDPEGRVWLLERGRQRILLLAPDDLHPLDTLVAPIGSDLCHLALGSAGALAADAASRGLFLLRFGGEWKRVSWRAAQPPADARPITVAARDDRMAALYRRGAESWVALVDAQGGARLLPVPDLRDALVMLVLPGGDLLIGCVTGPVGSTAAFRRFRVDADALRPISAYAVRAFDGRAVVWGALASGGDCSASSMQALATTSSGFRPLYPVLESTITLEGRIETMALDAERYGCAWHRVMVEVCVPEGTSVRLEARTSDELYPEPLRRDPRPPHGLPPSPAITAEIAADYVRAPLGSRAADDVEGWIALGALDRRAARSDIPFAPASPPRIETFEGLVKNPPGRYLWLRIHLLGTRRLSPAVSAIRVTYPRPSILAHLPAFFRADPAAAATMDQTLALFEGVLTELDVRIDALHFLFDPRVCPADALDWLASFISLALDSRLSEAKRRILIAEGAQLFRQRGTVAGLRRLCSIVAGCQVEIVEAFRTRRQSASFLGECSGESLGAILGEGFQLGADPVPTAGLSAPWELELQAAHDKLISDRQTARSQHPEQSLCPPEDPPPPLDPDPWIAFCRRYAHRFTVVIFRGFNAELAPLLETTVERSKPAHTLHELCWLEAGFRVGATTYVGLGTRLAQNETFSPAILDQSPLGSPTTLSVPARSRTLGTVLGADRVGISTQS